MDDFFYTVFYSYLRKLTPKPLCFITGSKTFKFLPMAGSCSQTKRVGTFGLMREPLGLYPAVPTTPGFGPCEAPGLYHGTSMGPGKVMGCQPQQDWEEKHNHSQDHRFLDTHNTMKVTNFSCSQQGSGTIVGEWNCG